MRVLITGGAGLTGHALCSAAPDDVDVEVTQRTRLAAGRRAHTVDLAEPGAVELLLLDSGPDLVIHTAYATDDGERDIVTATKNVVDACADAGVELVHFSSDMVFDGEHAPYREDDTLSPVTAYGRQKAAAEIYIREHLAPATVLRTSLICSLDPVDPRTAAVVEALTIGKSITLFTDEIRSAVRLDDLVHAVWEIALMESEARAGVWHLVGSEPVDRYALGLAIAAYHGLSPEAIVAGTSAESAAGRPRNLTLVSDRAAASLSSTLRPVTSLFAG
ncbi:MAG: hypothetical protein JJLCMIEE_02044 [Acidimicrobiales bacterium]|nr:hypothetical protein [Acidimicrobiales bacterium]